MPTQTVLSKDIDHLPKQRNSNHQQTVNFSLQLDTKIDTIIFKSDQFFLIFIASWPISCLILLVVLHLTLFPCFFIYYLPLSILLVMAIGSMYSD